MLFRLIMLVIAGTLLIGGAFLWINHINEETRMAEELNNLLPVKRKPSQQKQLTANNKAENTASATVNSAATTANKEKSPLDSDAISSNLTKLQNTIKELPNQLMASTKITDEKKLDSSDVAASNLALNSQPLNTYPAMTRDQALPLAKESAGKEDPLAQISGFKPFPSSADHKGLKSTTKEQSSNKNGLLPPPPVDAIPPPPPPILAGQSAQSDSLPVSELPIPPERPSIARHLKLVGIMGDKAFLSITDPYVRRANHLPKVLALAAGDRVDYLCVLAVTDSSVTLEEDGQKLVKHLNAIR